MKRDFEIDGLRAAVAAGWGVVAPSLTPLPGHAHSLNFKVESQHSAPFAAKCVPSARFGYLRRLVAHMNSVRSPIAASALFGGKVLDFRGWKVLAIRWIDGSLRYPDDLSDADIDAFLSAHSAFLDGLVDDGEILPARDPLAAKRSLAGRFKTAGAASLLRELKLMDDDALQLAPGELRIIHGDLHWENFRFKGGAVSGFLDIEELRFGTPAEDLVRYIVCRAEHLRWFELAKTRRLLEVFAQFVRRTRYSRREWLFAVNGYLLRKLEKKVRSSRVPWYVRLNLAFRFRFYRKLRETVLAETEPVRDTTRTVVKILGGTVKRFAGGRRFDWGERWRFVCDPACQDYDWLCVYDEIPRDWPELERGAMRLNCPASRTILATQEPVSVKFYNQAYVRQFAVLLTNRPRSAERHPGYVKGEGYMVWYTGRSFAEERAHEPGEKTKLVSAVCSAKRMRHTKHASRFRLMKLASRELEGFDWYGKGVRPLAAKSDALDPYKYHIAFENHIGPGHWTEKIADALVAGCLPFYAGDPEISSALPADCYIPIPPDDPEAAIAVIRKAVSEGEWEKRRGAIAEARRRLLERYNLFAQIAGAIESAPESRDATPVVPGCIVSRRRTRLVPSAAIADMLHHLARFAMPAGKDNGQ